MARHEYRGNAAKCTLHADILAADTAIIIDGDVSGWPTGAAGRNFVVVLDKGKTGMEKILCSTLSGQTVTAVTRGYDGTSARTHQSGAAAEHGFGAADLDDFGRHVYDQTHNDHTQYVRVDGTQGFSSVAGIVGTPVSIGTANAAGSASTLARSDHVHDIADGAIDHAGLFAAGVVDLAALASASVSTAKIVDAAVTPAKHSAGTRPLFVVANAAALAALTGMAAGDFALQADTHCLHEYSGSAWRGVVDVALGNRRTKRVAFQVAPGSTQDLNGADATFPTEATTNVAVPAWATSAIVTATINQAYAVTDTLNHTLRTAIGAVSGVDHRIRWAEAVAGGNGCVDSSSRQDVVLPDILNVSSVAGTTVAARIHGSRVSGTGGIRVTSESFITILVEFLEAA